MRTKDEIRVTYKKKRKEMPREEAEKKSLAAQNAFLKSEIYKKAKQIMLYMPLGNETGTELISAAKKDEKTIIFPVTDETSGKITPILWDGRSAFKKGAFSVREPDGEKADMTKTDVVVVPGVAFSPDGARIGFGKGCYDRFLENFSGLKIGFCYDFQISRDFMPDIYDVKMDFLVSESGFTVCEEERMNRREKAIENHNRGYNCAQAVLCAFCDKTGFSEDELFKISEGLGFGMGCGNVCGAVSAMTLLAGIKCSAGVAALPETEKKKSYALSGKMLEEFENKNKSIVCKKIKTGTLRSCDGCISDAVEILEKYL